jgi:hypothetical protein
VRLYFGCSRDHRPPRDAEATGVVVSIAAGYCPVCPEERLRPASETAGEDVWARCGCATRRGGSRTKGLRVVRDDSWRSSSRESRDRSGRRGSPRVERPGCRGPSPLCGQRHGRQAVICG